MIKIVKYGNTKMYSTNINGNQILSLTPLGLLETIKAFKTIKSTPKSR